jgi:hypothetical protein
VTVARRTGQRGRRDGWLRGRDIFVAAAAGLLLLLAPASAEAHPLTGGPATPGQIVVTVAGLVLVVGGGVGAFSTAGTEPERGLARLGRKLGMPALLVGLVTIFIGPDVITRIDSRCSVRPSTAAVLDVISPTEGQHFRSNAVPVRVSVRGGGLAPANVNKLEAGKGHLQISVDRILITRASNEVQVVQVANGNHAVLVEYVAGDHLPFCPKVAVTRNVKVGA